MKKLTFDRKACKLDVVNIFEDLPELEINKIAEICEWFEYEPEETIVRASRPDNIDDNHDVYFLISGTANVLGYQRKEGAKEDKVFVLNRINPGAQFGELSALDKKGRSANVISLTETLVARLSRKNFLQILLKHSTVSLKLLISLASLVRDGTEWISAITILSGHQRIYLQLLKVSEPNPLGDGTWLIDTAPRHGLLANLSGTSKGEVAKAIGGLVRHGIINREISGEHSVYLIKDLNRLKFLAGVS